MRVDRERSTGPGGRPPAPPGPRGWPLLGSLPHVGRDRLGLMVSATAQFGDAVRFRMGPRTLYLFNHPDHARHVLSENHANYRKGLGLSHARRALGDGLLTSEGELWRGQRRAVQPAFHRDRIAAATDVIVDEADRMLARWRSTAGSTSGAAGATVELTAEMTRLTLGVLGRALLRADLDSSAEISRAFEVVQDQAMFEMVTLNAVPSWLPLPRQVRFRWARRELDRLVARLVAERAEGVDSTAADLLSRLLGSAGQPGGTGREQLRDELVTVLLAGHETTASTLGWTWYLVERHPQVQERLHLEAADVLGDRRPTHADFARLTYTAQVVSEAMRLYPPVWMLTRQAIGADTIGGYPVPPGADVLICLYTLHRNPRFWDRPESFDPERFRTDRAAAHRYAYLPFGAGPRVCVGSHLGLLEAVLVVAMAAREFRMRSPTGEPVRPEPMLSLRLGGGLPMTLVRR